MRGNIELSTARYAAAEASFRQVLAIEEGAPSRSVYLLALSQVIEMQLAQNNIDGAEADADALLALGERNPQARYLKARVEVARNDLAGAERRLESLVAESPELLFLRIVCLAASMPVRVSLGRPRCTCAPRCGGHRRITRRGCS